MKVIVFSTKGFEQPYLEAANTAGHPLSFTPLSLSPATVEKAARHEAVVVFPGDDVSAPVLQQLHRLGVRYIAIRAVGYDNVDLQTAQELGIACANVPAYSPHAIAEHAVALILALNRKLMIADRQVHRHDFRVDRLVGFDLHKKTAGIVGTGKIGSVVARILHGFGCRLLGYDIEANTELVEETGLSYVPLEELCRQSDIITLNTPLNAATRYLINRERLALMKNGVLLVNTARGAVLNTADALEALESGKIGGLGMDVYEREKDLFFYDHSESALNDEWLEALLRHENVIVTPHQAFATHEALGNIAETTFFNLNCWAAGEPSPNELPARVTTETSRHPVAVPAEQGRRQLFSEPADDESRKD
jgi:D-lactate dehydrogenase